MHNVRYSRIVHYVRNVRYSFTHLLGTYASSLASTQKKTQALQCVAEVTVAFLVMGVGYSKEYT